MGRGRQIGGAAGIEAYGRPRIVALVASFLLLVAGFMVSVPGVVTVKASADSANGSAGTGNDDQSEWADGESHDEHESDDADGQDDDCERADESDGHESSDNGSKGAGANVDDSSGNHDDDNDVDEADENDDDEDESCTAALTLNKIVVNNDGGSASITDFVLAASPVAGGVDVIHGVDPNPSTVLGISATVATSTAYRLAETGPSGYRPSAWSCTSGVLVGATLTLAPGDIANCTITNDDIAPPVAKITVVKDVTNTWGGRLASSNFQLRIDNANVGQGEAKTVSVGNHTIGEVARPGYSLNKIVCGDATLGSNGVATVTAGQNVTCTVFNADVPAALTVVKNVINDNGGSAKSSDFTMQIDGNSVAQQTPVLLPTGTHVIGEVSAAGYRMVGVTCTDDRTEAAVVYDNGVNLALGQRVTCTVTNDDDPVDLVLTKSDDGLTKTAGGAPFDYLITVDNAGPRDASLAEAVTVVDQLPVGMEFVSFPAACAVSERTLTCAVDPADLQVADPAVSLTVTVQARADAAKGTYTNIAFVDTADDPACVGEGCVPTCASASNNVDCETTDIVRQASLSIDKSDSVDGPVHPGDSYDYILSLGNGGPSTILADLTATDDLPAELQLLGVSAPAPWSCNNTDPVVCTYGAAIQPNTTAPPVAVHVRLDPAFLGDSVHNVAQAIAVVDPPTSASQVRALAVSDPGAVLTATDDETTAVVHVANLSIDKTASRASATAGDLFDWVLAVTNHGPDTATGVVVNDTVPAGLTVVGLFATGGLACANTGNTVQCTAATLGNGAVASVTIQVRVVGTATPGVVTNTAAVTTTSSDPVASDNSDSASVTLTAVAELPPAPSTGVDAASGAQTLPRTGNGSLNGLLGSAGLLFGGGLISLVIARRRRAATA